MCDACRIARNVYGFDPFYWPTKIQETINIRHKTMEQLKKKLKPTEHLKLTVSFDPGHQHEYPHLAVHGNKIPNEKDAEKLQALIDKYWDTI